MKPMQPTLLALAAGLMFSAGAQAVFMPPGGQPLYIKFDNKEQISLSNSIPVPGGGTEGNWGILKFSTIALGDLSSDPIFWDPISPPIWVDSSAAEITGIFWGIQNLPGATCAAVGATICGTGGFIDLYWDNTPDANLGSATPAGRTGANTFTNFTDGTFLVRLRFNSGIASGDSNVHIVGTAAPALGGFAGLADSYVDVVDVNGDSVIDAADGPWAPLLNGNYFTTAFGQRDVRLRTIYNGPLPAWNGPAGTDIFGAQSSDPARVFTVPEPATLGLIGLGLLGLGLAGRRRTA